MFTVMLSKWALIPALILFFVSFIFSGLVGMASEDFQRDPTPLENFLSTLFLIPIVWLLIIVASNWLGFKRWPRLLNAICLVLIVAALVGFSAAVFYLKS